MAKIFIVRHQAAGLVHEFPFAESPSKEQIDAVASFCARSHGEVHGKTGESYWVRVEERELLSATDLPSVPSPGGVSTGNAAASGEFTVSGEGAVSEK